MARSFFWRALTGAEPIYAFMAPPNPASAELFVTASPKRVRAVCAGTTVVDSLAAVLLHEPGRTPVYYFPPADVRRDLLAPSGKTSVSPLKGDATHWALSVTGRAVADAAWSYPDPAEAAAAIRDFVAFRWHAMDSWWEEDEQVFVHPRDPFVRVDILPSTRPVEVVVGGVIVAASTRAFFVFETGLPTRYYLPRADVRMDLLSPTDTRTSCPYKGDAEYFSATVAGHTFDDIAWTYPEPVRDAALIRGYVCFFNEHVDAISIDGIAQPIPVTKWA